MSNQKNATNKPQSKSQQDTTIDSEVDPYDEIIAIFDSVNLRAKPREDILKWHHKQIAQEANKAYTKGYNTGWQKANRLRASRKLQAIEVILRQATDEIAKMNAAALTADKEPK